MSTASITIYRAMALALLGVCAGAVYSAMKPVQLRPAEPTPPAPAAATSEASAVTEPGPRAEAPLPLEISVAQAKALYDLGVPFIDARLIEDYEKGHVQNAFWMPASEFVGGVPEVMNLLDPAGTLVVYCSGGDCDASHNVVVLLQQAEFKACHIMTDGFPGWERAGLPVASGKPEIGGK